MKAYHFKDWDELYENNSSRTVVSLTYFCQPNKLVGEGVGFMLMQPDGLELYGTLGFLKGLASTSNRTNRGWLVRNGTPMDALRMAMLTRLPQEKIQRALDFFSTAPMDWLLLDEWTDGKPSASHRQAIGPPSDSRKTGHGISAGLMTDKMMTEDSTVPVLREREPSFARIQASRTQIGVLLGQIRGLEARKAMLDDAERVELRKKRRALKGLQDKQAAGDFSVTTNPNPNPN